MTAAAGPLSFPPPLNPKNTDASKESSMKRKKQKQKSSAKSKRLRHDSDSSSSSSGYSSDDAGGRGRRKGTSSKKRMNKDRRRWSVSRDRAARSRRKKSDGSEKARRKKKGRVHSVSVESESESESSSDDYSRRKRRSRSCSTFSRSSSSPERLDKRGKSRRRERSSGVKTAVIKKKDGKSSRRRRYRSPSCPTCSRSSRSRSSRRFTERSQLKEVGSGFNCGDDDGRVEITQDYANFPSSRSNDSFDVVNKRERRIAPVEIQEGARETGGDTRRWGAYDNWEEGGVMGEEERSYLGGVDGGSVMHSCGNDEMNYESQSARVPSVRVKSVIVVPAANAELVTDDLETILRQKALDNLKKFRGSVKPPGHQKDVLVQNDSCAASGLIVKAEQDDHQSSKGANVASKQNLTESEEKCEVQDGSCQVENGDKSVNKPPGQMASLYRTSERKNGSQVANSPNARPSPRLITLKTSTTSASTLNKRQHSPNKLQGEQEQHSENLLKQVPVERRMSDSKTATQSVSHKTETNKAQGSTSGLSSVPDYSAGKNNTNEPKSEARADWKTATQPVSHKPETNKAQGSTPGLSSVPDNSAGKNNTNERKSEVRTDSELENKTMTVMRGGEMVQVSYKVYIPKKTPALARRQLKR